MYDADTRQGGRVLTRGRGERLPKECLVVIPGLPAGKNVAVSKRWREGLEITQLNFGDKSHFAALRYAASSARTREGCMVPSCGDCPCGAAGGTENHSVV